MPDDELYAFWKETKEKNYKSVRERSISVLKINLLVLAGLVSLIAAVFGENNEILQDIILNRFTLLGISLSVMAGGSSGFLYLMSYISQKNTKEFVAEEYREGDYNSIEEAEQEVYTEGSEPTELATMTAVCVTFTAFSVPFISIGILDTLTDFLLSEVILFLLLSMSGVIILYFFITELYQVLQSISGTVRIFWSESNRVWTDGISDREKLSKIALFRLLSLAMLGILLYPFVVLLPFLLRALSIVPQSPVVVDTLELGIFLSLFLVFVWVSSIISEVILSRFYS